MHQWSFAFQFAINQKEDGQVAFTSVCCEIKLSTKFDTLTKQQMEVCILCNPTCFPITFSRSVTALSRLRRLRPDCAQTSSLILCLSQRVWIECLLLNLFIFSKHYSENYIIFSSIERWVVQLLLMPSDCL